jgi:hypothetical protein
MPTEIETVAARMEITCPLGAPVLAAQHPISSSFVSRRFIEHQVVVMTSETMNQPFISPCGPFLV